MPIDSEMPRYKCHKEVRALKIAHIVGPDVHGDCIITPEDKGYGGFPVSADYMAKHSPKAGGYYVVYKDGYRSFSPAPAFEEGYTRL